MFMQERKLTSTEMNNLVSRLSSLDTFVSDAYISSWANKLLEDGTVIARLTPGGTGYILNIKYMTTAEAVTEAGINMNNRNIGLFRKIILKIRKMLFKDKAKRTKDNSEWLKALVNKNEGEEKQYLLYMWDDCYRLSDNKSINSLLLYYYGLLEYLPEGSTEIQTKETLNQKYSETGKAE